MKRFTQISKFAAMAAMAAIGISLYACEEKDKASKPTEAANGIFGTPIDIDNIPFGADIEKVKQTYGVQLESFTYIDNELFRATGTFKNKFAFGFADNKLERVVIFCENESDCDRKDLPFNEKERIVQSSYVEGNKVETWDYKNKLLVEYDGMSGDGGNYTIKQGSANSLLSDFSPKFGSSIEEVKKEKPNIKESKDGEWRLELLSVGVRTFCGKSENNSYCYLFYQGKYYSIDQSHEGEISGSSSYTDPNVGETVQKLLAEKKK
jgi:hypothetical protein